MRGRQHLTDHWIGIECDWQSEPKPSPEALATATELVGAARAAGIPPEAATTGYWPTVRLIWDGGRTEVEVFDGSYELYFLPTSPEEGEYEIFEYDAKAPNVLATLLSKIAEMRSREPKLPPGPTTGRSLRGPWSPE